ncbi:hypothetical protein, partial [Hafnia paralvei]|uniref:hypothetical protein n=1 Tax=Hafnia paralvei TaxID=546367 RepID=UPI0027B8CFF2
DVCVVVPGQWWRIIGTSERLTTPNYKIFFNRAKFTQKNDIKQNFYTCFVFIFTNNKKAACLAAFSMRPNDALTTYYCLAII